MLGTKEGYLPTLTAGDAKATRNSTALRKRIPPTGVHSGNTLTDVIVPKRGGGLNPEWAEWYMGVPIGFSAIEPLATDRFRQWLNSHCGCLREREAKRLDPQNTQIAQKETARPFSVPSVPSVDDVVVEGDG